MTPNNNFSVLPWYKSIEEQNARKWWVYGRIYPLFSPSNRFLPFQVMREHIGTLSPVPLPYYEEYDETTLDDNGNMIPQYDCTVTVFEVPEGVTTVHFIDPEDQLSGSVFCSMLNENDIVLGTYPNDISHGTFDMALPTGTTKINVVTYDTGSTIIDIENVTYFETVTPRVTQFDVYDIKGNLIGNFLSSVVRQGLETREYPDDGYDIIVYPSGGAGFFTSVPEGRYYIVMSDGTNTWYSDVFTVVHNIAPFLKLTWWDDADFIMDAGRIAYNPSQLYRFKNVLYLPVDIAKPEYEYDEEVIERDGYVFPVKQISSKKYKFNFLSPEYLLDVMRFVRMSDHIQISNDGDNYINIDSFLITPDWEGEGDIASVDVEFTTDTVAKKIGLGYVREINR